MPRKRRESKSNPMVTPAVVTDNEDDYFSDDNSNSGKGYPQPQHRNAANARERARMRVLSKAFSRLKTKLPWVPPDTKLSKLDTLRLAASYIAHLRAVLTDDPHQAPPSIHPLNLTWPFSFQNASSGSTHDAVSPTSPWNGAPATSMAAPPPEMDRFCEKYPERYPHHGLAHADIYDKMDECWYQNMSHRGDGYIRHAFSETMLHIG